MRSRSKRRRAARLVLSWLLAWAMLANSWPTPALQQLLGPQEALAAEEAVEQVAQDDEAVAEASDESAVADVADESDAEEETPVAAEPVAAAAQDDQVAAPTADEDIVLEAASDEDGDGEDDDLYEVPYDERYPYDVFIDDTYKDAPVKNLYTDKTYTINFTCKAVENSNEISNVEPGSIPGNDGHRIMVEMGYMYTVKEATETEPAECEYLPEAHWYEDGSRDNCPTEAFIKRYDRESGTGSVELNTEWLYENYFKDHPDKQLHVEIWVLVPNDHVEPPYRQAHPYHPTGESFWLRAPNVDYRPVGSGGMLPGWDDFIDRNNSAWVENSDHPWGENINYQVTNVEAIDGAEHFEIEEQDNGWNIHAKDHGETTFRVTHTTVDDNLDSYEFTRTVSDNVYSADLWIESESGSSTAFPDESITLTGRGRHQHEEAEDTYDGFTYDWEIVDGDEFADIFAEDNPDGSSTGIVTFHHYDGDGTYDEKVLVRMTATKDGTSASQDIWLHVSNDYPEIWFPELNACTINPNALPLGSSITVTPEVRRFTQPGKDMYEVCNLRSLSWEFDENCIEIMDGPTGEIIHSGDVVSPSIFTITRKGNWGTNISLNADWYDEGWGDDGMRHEHANWWLFDSIINAWLDDEGRNEVYSDGTLSLWLRTSNQISELYQIYLNVGPWNQHPGEEGFDWADQFAEGAAFTYNRETGEIVIDGAWLFENGYDHAQVFLAVAYEPNGSDEPGPIVSSDGRWINVREAEVDYDRERDRNMLPGWDGSIDGNRNVRVQNSAYPEGEDFEYRVTDVEVISGGEHLAEFHKDFKDGDEGSDDYWWYYRAGSQGTVTFKVTYEIPAELGGGLDAYTFNLNIGTDVYDIDITADPEDDNLLPGSVIELYAQGCHHRFDESTGDHQDSTEGLDYQWEVVEGSDMGRLGVDPQDSRHATFLVDAPSSDEENVDGFVHVRAYLYDGGAESVANIGWAFDVHSSFVEPHPTSINRKLGIGASETVDLKLQQFEWNMGPTTIDDAEFSFWFDPNCVTITDTAGNEVMNNGGRNPGDEVSYPAGNYTITRTGNWGTDINVRAVWHEHGNDNERHEYWRRWRLDELDYRFWFDCDHDRTLWIDREGYSYSNPFDLTSTLSVSDDVKELLDQGAHVEWKVGTWVNDHYTETFGPESGLYTVSDDGLSITSNAVTMADWDIWDLRVTAALIFNGKELREADGDFWFHLRERTREIGLPQNADMLPGWEWTDWIAHDVDVYLNDELHDHEHGTHSVTDIEVDDPNVAIAFDDGSSWTLQAQAYGETVAHITYEDYDGTIKTWDVPVRVGTDVYTLEVGDDGAWYSALPGQSVTIPARARHDYKLPDGMEGSTEDQMYIEWHLDWNASQIASVTYNPDGTQGVVTFKEIAGDENPWNRDIWVDVLIIDAATGNRVSESGIIVSRLADISQAEVRLEDTNFTYTGSPQTPASSVFFAGQRLEEGSDYTVGYANNINAGNAAQVIVTGMGRFGGEIVKTFSIAKAQQTINATDKSVAMGKTVSLAASASGALTYQSSNTAVAKVAANGVITPVKVGTATITIKAAETANYASASKTVKVTVTKGAQPMTVKAKTVSVKLSKVNKANQNVKVKKVMTIAKAQGTKSFKKTKGSKKITINKKTGTLTVAKGTKKGTYKIKVKVSAKGNTNWNAGSKTVTIVVKVK